MVMKPTRATPIINAAAVADVRLGLRIAFCRANVPEHALQAWQRRTDDPADRTGQDGAEHCDTDEDQHRHQRRPAPCRPHRTDRHPWRLRRAR